MKRFPPKRVRSPKPVASSIPINLPFDLTLCIWSFIDNKTIKKFTKTSKNTRKALEITQLVWKRLRTYVCNLAAENGYLDILKLARQINCPWDEYTPAWAARGGHLEIVKWVRSMDTPCPWDKWTPAWAAENGHLEIVKYYHESGHRWDKLIPECAARYGHLHIVKYCYENGYEWNWKTPACAARYGHLHIVKWLRSRDPPCPWNRLMPAWAALNGHLEIVKYCYENGCEWEESRIRKKAQIRNHHHILEYLDFIQQNAKNK